MKPKSTLRSFLLLASSMILVSSAHAASGNWTGLGADSLWKTAGNWSASPVPTTAQTATFNGAGNSKTSIDLTGLAGIRTITFDTASAAAYTLGTGGGGTPYETWAGPGVLFDADANGDGVKNGFAFPLGASGPNTSVTLPTVSRSGGGLMLTFDCLASSARGTATLNVQHGSDLGINDGWASALVTGATILGTLVGDVNFVVSDPEPEGGLLHVVAMIQSGAADAGKLFGRLEAVNA